MFHDALELFALRSKGEFSGFW